MLKFYYHPSPNPAKVALFLEESGLPYELMPVDTAKGEQHGAAYRAINPNGKTPALVDGDAVVFDSNAILLYLAVKYGKFLPVNQPEIRSQMYSWLMFIATGIGPFSGQAVHFRHFAPEPKTYAVNRYDFEATRHWKIIEDRLATRNYMVNEEFTIVDMALWGWARALPFVFGEQAWIEYLNVKRFLDRINARPNFPPKPETSDTLGPASTRCGGGVRDKLSPRAARSPGTSLLCSGSGRPAPRGARRVALQG